jgi:hypothetical protein
MRDPALEIGRRLRAAETVALAVVAAEPAESPDHVRGFDPVGDEGRIARAVLPRNVPVEVTVSQSVPEAGERTEP